MLILEKRDPATVDPPASGKFAIFIDSVSGHMVCKDSTDTITVLSANPIP